VYERLVTAEGFAAQYRVTEGLVEDVVEPVVTTYLIVRAAPSLAEQVMLAEVLEVSDKEKSVLW